MANLFSDKDPEQTLCTIARKFYKRGWMAGTAGNLSLRDSSEPDKIWITASGKPKGQLTTDDIILISLEDATIIEKKTAENKASAEVSIHQTIYKLFPQARACFHVHSTNALIATQKYARQQSELNLPAIEMIKGLNIWDADPNISLAIFENHSSVPDIANDMQTKFRKNTPKINAFMIRNHGITVWSENAQTAFNQTEIVEFILEYMARQE